MGWPDRVNLFYIRKPLKRKIIVNITIFSLIIIYMGGVVGVNTTGSTNFLNNSSELNIPENKILNFGSINVIDSNYNPIFCLITLYDQNGIVKVSKDTNNFTINKIDFGSHIYIESKEKNISLDFLISSDSLNPVIKLENYGRTNPISDYNPPGLPLKYVSIDVENLSYNNLLLTIDYLDIDETIDAANLRIFKYVETFAYNEWVELPTEVDEINKVVSTNVDYTSSIFAVSILNDISYSNNVTVGEVSVLDSIGAPLAAEIEIISPKGFIASSTGALSVDEVPQGSHLIINSTEMNISLDFILNNNSMNPIILLEDFGADNPAGDYSPPGNPLKYIMISAENLGYSGVNLTIHCDSITKNIDIFKLTETFAYNEWEELSAVIDKTNNTISTSLNSLSIFALCEESGRNLNILDIDNRPLTVDIKTYDHEKAFLKSKLGYVLSPDEIPEAGYIKLDALDEKGVAITINSADLDSDDIILENFGKRNPKNVNPNRPFLKFVEIHTGNVKYESAEIEITYSDDEIASLDETKLQIAHFINGEWIKLDSDVDTENNIVRALTDSFSTFALIYNGTSVNTMKSIYLPGDTAEIVIVVLDSAGAPVNNASIQMNITAPNGSTESFSSSTSSIMETSDPGVYESSYLTGIEGIYNISCTAIIEGSESRFETYFLVQSQYDFDIIRNAQSKIDPTKFDTFDVSIDIISHTNADTITIWEYVPANFEVYTDAEIVDADNLKVLKWQRSLVNNRTPVNYSYSVPMEWPRLYQLGPVEVNYGNKTFTEARPWWVAVDPEGGPDCINCHDIGKAALNQINISSMNATGAVHKYLNNDTAASNSSAYYANNKRCWACHGNGTTPPSSGHPDNYKIPYVCGDCHNLTYNLTYTNSTRIANLTKRPVAEHLQPPYYEDINSTVVSSNATCLGCHNNSLISFNDTGFNLSANISHYASTTDLVTPTVQCTLCHKDATNASLYWASQIRHPAKPGNYTFCDNCHNTSTSTTFHKKPIVKPYDIHRGFDWKDDDHTKGWNQLESCYYCHYGDDNKNPCEICHIVNQSGPEKSGLRSDINETMPFVYAHTNQSSLLNVPNQSGVYGGQTLTSCYAWNKFNSTGNCHGIIIDKRIDAGGYYAVTNSGGLSSPYHNTTTIDRLPDTTNCTFCHNQSDVTIRKSWGNATQITQSAGIHLWYTGPNNSLCFECHVDTGNAPFDFHAQSMYVPGGPDCVKCHDLNMMAWKEVDVSNMNQSGNMHKNLNNGTVTSYNPDNERCWACHGNASEPGDRHPTNFLIPYNCLNCHNSTPFLAYTTTRIANLTTKPVLEHYTNGSEIRTTVNCSLCHQNSIAPYNDPDGGSMAANLSHYGTNTSLKDTVGYSTDGCKYCHLNYTNSLKWGNATDLTNVTFPRNHTETTNNQCWICHIDDNVTINSFHNESVNPGWDPECIGCHFLYDYMANKNTSVPGYMNNSTAITKYVNGTMFNNSVHSLQTGIQCRNCHTKFNRSEHPPPEYSWKWCECCHSYQTDPLTESDRHNVTDDPLNYSVNISGTPTPVLDITNCTVCHDATQYNIAKDTYNRTSGNDCRYCHYLSDQSFFPD